jgi:hypothetical protein
VVYWGIIYITVKWEQQRQGKRKSDILSWDMVDSIEGKKYQIQVMRILR